MEALLQPVRAAPPQSWIDRWPQCVLLLQLTLRCVETGGSPACSRLLKRLLESRERMKSAPPVVDSLLSELWYAAVLATRSDLPSARHHAAMAAEKARRVQTLVREVRTAESRRRCLHLRQRSSRLQARTQDLLRTSQSLLTRSIAAHCRARQSALALLDRR